MPENKAKATAEDVAARYNVAVKTVYGWTSARSVPFLKVGNRVRFDLDELDRWFAEKARPGDAA